MKVSAHRPSEADLDLMPDPDAIEQRPVGGVRRAVLYLLAVFIIAILTWASIAEIDEMVTARGRLVSIERNLVVQPLETSIVESIDVRVGQVVRKGEVLATLDATFTEANRSTAQAGLQSLEARARRPEIELGPSPQGNPQLAFGASTHDRLQHELGAAREANYKARMQALVENIARIKASINTNSHDQRLLDERLKALSELEAMQQQLADLNFGARRSLLEARERRLGIERDLEQVRNREQELKLELATAQAELQAWKNEWRARTAEELAHVSREKQAASDELSKAKRRRGLITMTSPMDAVVLEVSAASIGAVVREAEPMFKLVPLNYTLEAELQVNPQDIGFLSVGQGVKLKMDAFPFQRHGVLTGTIKSISKDAIPSQSGAEKAPTAPSYYLALVKVESSALRQVQPDSVQLPGLTLNAQIAIGRRKVIWYFLAPVVGVMDDALRERR